MTPKEKAVELVNKYVNLSKITASSEYIQYQAKKCALIAVDEILNAINPFGQFLGKDYWNEVKQEIELL
jgi:5-bromo-4-chloroindolyl phosphate hydrolysis protein